jgi:hypothetical protein
MEVTLNYPARPVKNHASTMFNQCVANLKIHWLEARPAWLMAGHPKFSQIQSTIEINITLCPLNI